MNLDKLDVLNPIRKKLDTIIISHPKQAEIVCKLIPASCPFATALQHS
jgi:hypothetical protein